MIMNNTHNLLSSDFKEKYKLENLELQIKGRKSKDFEIKAREGGSSNPAKSIFKEWNGLITNRESQRNKEKAV